MSCNKCHATMTSMCAYGRGTFCHDFENSKNNTGSISTPSGGGKSSASLQDHGSSSLEIKIPPSPVDRPSDWLSLLTDVEFFEYTNKLSQEKREQEENVKAVVEAVGNLFFKASYYVAKTAFYIPFWPFVLTYKALKWAGINVDPFKYTIGSAVVIGAGIIAGPTIGKAISNALEPYTTKLKTNPTVPTFGNTPTLQNKSEHAPLKKEPNNAMPTTDFARGIDNETRKASETVSKMPPPVPPVNTPNNPASFFVVAATNTQMLTGPAYSAAVKTHIRPGDCVRIEGTPVQSGFEQMSVRKQGTVVTGWVAELAFAQGRTCDFNQSAAPAAPAERGYTQPAYGDAARRQPYNPTGPMGYKSTNQLTMRDQPHRDAAISIVPGHTCMKMIDGVSHPTLALVDAGDRTGWVLKQPMKPAPECR